MWTDITIASAVLIFIALIFRFHQVKITTLEQKKLDKEIYDQLQSLIKQELVKELKRGEQNFSKIFELLSQHGEMLARIDERSLNWAKKNGGK